MTLPHSPSHPTSLLPLPHVTHTKPSLLHSNNTSLPSFHPKPPFFPHSSHRKPTSQDPSFSPSHSPSFQHHTPHSTPPSIPSHTSRHTLPPSPFIHSNVTPSPPIHSTLRKPLSHALLLLLSVSQSSKPLTSLSSSQHHTPQALLSISLSVSQAPKPPTSLSSSQRHTPQALLSISLSVSLLTLLPHIKPSAKAFKPSNISLAGDGYIIGEEKESRWRVFQLPLTVHFGFRDFHLLLSTAQPLQG